jgi:P pilus assembly chaperone PapD
MTIRTASQRNNGRQRFWRTGLGVALFWTATTVTAALHITPPQLAPDEQGVVATEVKSSLANPSRWSVRIVAWDPSQPQDSTPDRSTMPISITSAPDTVTGVDISPRFFSLAGSGRQMIRARITDRSRHYRLLIEQIPDDQISGKGVNFRFRFSLPIYRSSQDPLIPRGIIIQ